MRGINGWTFSMVLGVLLTGGWAIAQDSAKSTVQVIIGADGCVKVIDPKTGKEIASVVTKVQPSAAKEKAKGQPLEFVFPAQFFQIVPQPGAKNEKKEGKKEGKGFQIELQFDGPGDKAKKEKKEGKKEGKAVEIELNGLQLFWVGPDGKAKALQGSKGKPAPAGVEQKIDLLLKQMDELRKDVNQLKNKLDGKKAEGLQFKMLLMKEAKEKEKKQEGGLRFQFSPGAGGLQLDKESAEKLREMLKKLESERDRKKATEPGSRERPPINRNAELEQRLERLLREAEELRREISKGKSSRR